ncbi:MAG: hypothetical protein AAF648_05320 [Pseudomonadota bacterium]
MTDQDRSTPDSEVARERLNAQLNRNELHRLDGIVRLSWPLPASGEELRELSGPSFKTAQKNTATARSRDTGTLVLAIGEHSLEWLDASAREDVTFYFESAQAMLAILEGQVDPIEAFMQGTFQSSGYLLWTFPLLSLFNRGTVATPDD